jgi:hypothetical protein
MRRTGASFRILQMIGSAEFEIAPSVPLAVEYEGVAGRESAELGFTLAEGDVLMGYWCGIAHLLDIHLLWRPVLRDIEYEHVSTISLRLPDSLRKKVRELEKSEDVSIDQLIVTALAEKMSALMTVDHLRERGALGDRSKYDAATAKMSDAEPDKGHELPCEEGNH